MYNRSVATFERSVIDTGGALVSFDGEYLRATFGYHHRMLELTYHTTVGTTQGMVGLEESYLGQLLDQRIPLITTTRLISVWKWLLETQVFIL